MTHYYFVAPALPALQLESPPEISFEELIFLLEVNLTSKDLKLGTILRRYYDVLNVRNLLKKEPFLPFGTMNPAELEEALQGADTLPDYFFEFTQKYSTSKAQLENFSSLLAAYYRKESRVATRFLKELLQFDHAWQLVMVALRAKTLGRDLLKEFQYEDIADPLVKQLANQKEGSSIEVPEEFVDLKALYEENKEAPLALHRAHVHWRFQKIERMLAGSYFSVDRVLGYIAQLFLLEELFKEGNQAVPAWI